jgi:hypothetical protein
MIVIKTDSETLPLRLELLEEEERQMEKETQILSEKVAITPQNSDLLIRRRFGFT